MGIGNQYVPLSGPFPDHYDMIPKIFEVFNQGTWGSCTANGLLALLEEMKRLQFSRRFVYYMERYLENRIGQEGANPIDALNAAVQFGVSLESLCPYVDAEMNDEPSAEAKADALNRKITDWDNIALPGTSGWRTQEQCDAIEHSFKSALVENLPVVCALPVGTDLRTVSGPWTTHKMRTLDMSGTIPGSNHYLGRHMVSVFGWDDRVLDPCPGWIQKGVAGVLNSWGTTRPDGTPYADGGFVGWAYASFWQYIEFAAVVRGFMDVEIAQPTPSDWLPEAEVVAVYNRLNFCPDAPGVAYWRDPAHGGLYSLITTIQSMTKTNGDALLKELGLLKQTSPA